MVCCATESGAANTPVQPPCIQHGCCVVQIGCAALWSPIMVCTRNSTYSSRQKTAAVFSFLTPRSGEGGSAKLVRPGPFSMLQYVRPALVVHIIACPQLWPVCCWCVQAVKKGSHEEWLRNGYGERQETTNEDNAQTRDTSQKAAPKYARLTLHDEVEVAEWAPVPNYF